MKKRIVSNSPDDTMRIGRRLAVFLRAGDNIILDGDLGSGKTLFTKGIARGLKVPNYEYVNSPSFTLVKQYKGRVNLYHFDLYRLERLEDIEYIGVKEYLSGFGIVVIEWACRMGALLPSQYLAIKINTTGPSSRNFLFEAKGRRYDHIISRYFRR
ncbi:MAG: tRNA (adenosine(37)-N6)-threonylcarbamoyltransferase complex ATPase subunit type 1 TsaE [Candidatus Omnitrophica bacterium]|jgi:tRNA threonylcarbamoyladenosine biosynthesis protein TsaE|nr:tRNA (adenosine(37)-N6)-threonylcarbamoyltransferase complex ATPase subunit type 1 TsaE [Candidatus Omnitrophota bacterium]